MTSCGSRRDGGAVCCKISCCSFIQTATHKHRPTERIFDAFRCIKPVELRMYQLLQTAVELLGTSNHTSCRVQHSLKLVSDSLWNPGENDVAVVDSRHHSHVLQRSDYHLSNARHSISLWQCALSEWLLKRLSDRLFDCSLIFAALVSVMPDPVATFLLTSSSPADEKKTMPLFSNRQHRHIDDWLEDNREDY